MIVTLRRWLGAAPPAPPPMPKSPPTPDYSDGLQPLLFKKEPWGLRVGFDWSTAEFLRGRPVKFIVKHLGKPAYGITVIPKQGTRPSEAGRG